jgi:hypothetical protein
MKPKITIKAPEKMYLVMGKILALYGDGFANWLDKNMERLVKEWEKDWKADD